MTNDIKTRMLKDLGNEITTMASTIVVIASQGYVVNTLKYSKINAMLLVSRFIKDYDSFDQERKDEIETIFNLL